KTSAPEAPVPETPPEQAPDDVDLEALSDEEIDRLLDDEAAHESEEPRWKLESESSTCPKTIERV
ncbi:MAG: hypothetical protein Q8M07_10450, partial [Prosthecobacter sp.]|nr:hypothetical protein [Prosthecobacter sp.]